MTFKGKIAIMVAVIVGFDAIGSILSRSLHFHYENLVWVSFLLYAAAGYWGALRRGFGFGVVLGAIAGLGDSTIGWFAALRLHASTAVSTPEITPLLASVVVISVTITAIMLSLIGATVCKALGHTKTGEP